MQATAESSLEAHGRPASIPCDLPLAVGKAWRGVSGLPYPTLGPRPSLLPQARPPPPEHRQRAARGVLQLSPPAPLGRAQPGEELGLPQPHAGGGEERALPQLMSARWAQTQDLSSRHHLVPARAEQGQKAGTEAQGTELGGEVTGARTAGFEGPLLRAHLVAPSATITHLCEVRSWG